MARPQAGTKVHVITPSGGHRLGEVYDVVDDNTVHVTYPGGPPDGSGNVQLKGIMNCPRTEKGAHTPGSWHWPEHH